MSKENFSNYILSLAEKWLNGTINPEEEKDFANWYNSFNDEKELLVDTNFAQDEATLKKRILNTIESRLTDNNYESGLPQIRRTSLFKRYRIQVAAAAAVLLGVLIIAGVLSKQQKGNLQQEEFAVIKEAKDISPGGNKAILTLANGKKIVLDSLANGKIATEDDNEITKTADGKLLYGNTNVAHELQMNNLTTPRGGQYQLDLSDGTKAWLNSASSITFPTAFTGKERLVEITGEVYFEVVKNAAMPFKVKSHNAEVEVLGTHFDFNAYENDPATQVTLLEGSVKVKKNLAENTVIIKPGQQAQISAKATVDILNNIDAGKVMAWKTGFFEFDNTDLPTIMRQIARWYDVDIVFNGTASTEKFGGRINRNLPLSKVLELLEQNNVRFRLEGKKLIVG